MEGPWGLGWRGGMRPEGPSSGPLGLRTLTYSRTLLSDPVAPVASSLGGRPLPNLASTSSQFPGPQGKTGVQNMPPTLPCCQALPSPAHPRSPTPLSPMAPEANYLDGVSGGVSWTWWPGWGAGGGSGVEFCSWVLQAKT